MEENNNNLRLEEFTSKYVKEIPQAEISKNFTVSLLDIIAKEDKKTTILYAAIISKKMWFFILSIVGVLFLISSDNSSKSYLFLSKTKLTFMDSIQFPNLFENFSVSNTTTYAVLLFSIMMLVQLFYLKKYFERKIQ